MTNIEKCPICDDKYTEEDRKIEYHVTYRPEVTTYACDGCNYAEYLIQHPEIKTTYFMEKRKNIVREWTLKNRPQINFPPTKISLQLSNLKSLNLPRAQFIVVSSGAMSIREIRESEDLDVMVTQQLWDELAKKYKIGINSFGVQNMEPAEDIEILHPVQSMFGNSSVVPIQDIFEKADTFDGIKFINLEHLKKVKLKLGRDKDLRDIELIDEYLKNQTN